MRIVSDLKPMVIGLIVLGMLTMIAFSIGYSAKWEYYPYSVLVDTMEEFNRKNGQ